MCCGLFSTMDLRLIHHIRCCVVYLKFASAKEVDFCFSMSCLQYRNVKRFCLVLDNQK